MITAVIVEDEKIHQEALLAALEEYCPEVKIKAVFSKGAEALASLPQMGINLLFLDIRLSDMDSFEMLERLPGGSFHIIFITAFDEYALHAFKVNAVDYLLKPVSGQELRMAVSKAMVRILTREDQYGLSFDYYIRRNHSICISGSRSYHFIPVEDILYCQSSGNYTEFIYFNSVREIATELATRNILFFEHKLSSFGFIRVHQSYLVNGEKIQKILRNSNELVLNNGTRLSISRDKKKAILFMLRG